MTSMKWLTRTALAAGALVLAGCSGDFTTAPVLSPAEAALNELETGYVNLAKIGPAGTYLFEASETGVPGGLLGTSFNVVASPSDSELLYHNIWAEGDPAAGPSDLTITEVLTPGLQVDSIRVVLFTSAVLTSDTWYYGTNTVTVEGLTSATDAFVKFYNSYMPPPPGGEGCTPGFWRQEQHFDSWTGYTPNQLFSSVFEDAFPGMTLGDVVWLGGGDLQALGRHTVAALLNASSPDVDYPWSVQEVIDAFNDVFPGGDYEGLKDEFEMANEAGCELD